MPDQEDHILNFLYQGDSGLSLPAKVEYFSQLESWLDEICDCMAIDQKIRMQLQISADEIFTNICYYAYPEQVDNGIVIVKCSFDTANSELILFFSDHGVNFNPLTHVGAPRSTRKGGVGLLMVRNFADTLHYERHDDCNVLMLKKKICEKGAGGFNEAD